MKNLLLILIGLSLTACILPQSGTTDATPKRIAEEIPEEEETEEEVQTSKVDESTWTVFDPDDRMDYPATNITDNDPSTFWTTTSLNMGDDRVLVFGFQNAINLHHITIEENYVNSGFLLGDLKIYVSSDSTDGSNGTWTEIGITSIDPLAEYLEGEGTINIEAESVKFIRLEMTYNGERAYGGSPSFYLSEIDFYQVD